MMTDYARRENREPVRGDAKLTWEAEGQARDCQARVRNLTGGGLQAEARQAIPVGTPVFLSGTQFECYGEVRYCIRAGQFYRFGIEFLREPYYRCFSTSVKPA